MKDALTGRTRTWPYGTTKAVEVLEVQPRLLLCKDGASEGYIIIDGYADEATAKPGDRGTITFTAGGPTGGHWCYKSDVRRHRRQPAYEAESTAAATKKKYWCPDCRHYCTVDCCDHWNKNDERILE